MKEFIENPENFSNLEKRVYKHLLRKKIAHALKELEYINDKIIEGTFSSKFMDKNWGKILLSRGSGVRVPPGPLLK